MLFEAKWCNKNKKHYKKALSSLLKGTEMNLYVSIRILLLSYQWNPMEITDLLNTISLC